MIIHTYLAVAIATFCMSLLGLRRSVKDFWSLVLAVAVAANCALVWPLALMGLLALSRIKRRAAS